MITTNVPLNLAILSSDACLDQLISKRETMITQTNVSLSDVLKLKDSSPPQLTVTTTTHVLKTAATLQLENAPTLKEAVMMEMHVPLIPVTRLADVSTILNLVMTTTDAL
jgi:hypothetical protein